LTAWLISARIELTTLDRSGLFLKISSYRYRRLVTIYDRSDKPRLRLKGVVPHDD
jgi:hypothetical protein